MSSLLERYERQAVILRETRELPLSVREGLARDGIARFLGLAQPENFDAHANFAYSTVATAPSPATSGTSLVVAAGGGALFPTPPFNATVWPASLQPLASNAEIVRVTGISTDTLTIVRAQESSSAQSIVVGDQIAATITKKTITDVEVGGVGRSSAPGLSPQARPTRRGHGRTRPGSRSRCGGGAASPPIGGHAQSGASVASGGNIAEPSNATQLETGGNGVGARASRPGRPSPPGVPHRPDTRNAHR